jgi:hypothetical protein
MERQSKIQSSMKNQVMSSEAIGSMNLPTTAQLDDWANVRFHGKNSAPSFCPFHELL